MLRTYVYERTYVVLKYDRRLKYPLCYDPQENKYFISILPWQQNRADRFPLGYRRTS